MESFVEFGPGDRLVGVLTEPASPRPSPIVVLPSAGLLPRAGPFRLHVELARRLADAGVSTFRFDVPGVGEAPRLKGCASHEATLAAIDRLATRRGPPGFVVGGVCAAADVAWSAAREDNRVCGMLMLDGLSYTGPWFKVGMIRNALRRPAHQWPGMARRLTTRMRDAPRPVMDDYRDWPTRERARAELRQLVERDVHSLWIFTGGYSARFLHPRQFRWSFGQTVNDPRVEMRYWPDCDHTFFDRRHRDRLLDTIQTWVHERFADEGMRA